MGVDNGGIMNGVCNDMGTESVDIPVQPSCPSRWFYWNQPKESWLLDDTMSLRCIGIT